MATSIIGHRLLPRQLSFRTPSAQQCRLYAFSRFPHRTTGFGRDSRGNKSRRLQPDYPSKHHPWTSPNNGGKPFVDNPPLWEQKIRPTADSEAGLKRLLVNNDDLVVTR